MKYLMLTATLLVAACGGSPKTNESVAKILCFDKMNTGEFSIKKTTTYVESDHWRFVYAIQQNNGVPDYRRCTISKSDSRLPNPETLPELRTFSEGEIPSDYPNRPGIAEQLNRLVYREQSCGNMNPDTIMQWSQASGKHRDDRIAYWIMCGGKQMTFHVKR